ncbi:MAG: helix-turn-helix transcriptional regulator [Mycobacterium sp.]|nr:helix-turn-helix transcriptional regulator [Mycobacterium sp.]
MSVVLRQVLGDCLRDRRQTQGRTLREVSAAARVSLGYLSEVERGQKEASSELLAAICDALKTPLADLLEDAAHEVRARTAVPVLVPVRGGDGASAPVVARARNVVGAPPAGGRGDASLGALGPVVLAEAVAAA